MPLDDEKRAFAEAQRNGYQVEPSRNVSLNSKNITSAAKELYNQLAGSDMPTDRSGNRWVIAAAAFVGLIGGGALFIGLNATFLEGNLIAQGRFWLLLGFLKYSVVGFLSLGMLVGLKQRLPVSPLSSATATATLALRPDSEAELYYSIQDDSDSDCAHRATLEMGYADNVWLTPDDTTIAERLNLTTDELVDRPVVLGELRFNEQQPHDGQLPRENVDQIFGDGLDSGLPLNQLIAQAENITTPMYVQVCVGAWGGFSIDWLGRMESLRGEFSLGEELKELFRGAPGDRRFSVSDEDNYQERPVAKSARLREYEDSNPRFGTGLNVLVAASAPPEENIDDIEKNLEIVENAFNGLTNAYTDAELRIASTESRNPLARRRARSILNRLVDPVCTFTPARRLARLIPAPTRAVYPLAESETYLPLLISGNARAGVLENLSVKLPDQTPLPLLEVQGDDHPLRERPSNTPDHTEEDQ